jgi:hypothetical protein
MGFTWLEDKRIAGFDPSGSICVPDNTLARDHMKKFPLRTMGMVRPIDLVWRYPANLDIERVPLVQIHRLRFTP